MPLIEPVAQRYSSDVCMPALHEADRPLMQPAKRWAAFAEEGILNCAAAMQIRCFSITIGGGQGSPMLC